MKLFLFIFFIIFIPIPIKLSFFISRENYYLKLYRFYLLKKKKNINTKTPEIKTPPLRKTKKKPSLLKGLSPKTIMQLIRLFNSNKFKPVLKLKGYFSYSLGDAAKTAIFYGILSTCFPLLLFALNIIFRTKKFNLPITPVFEDKFIAKTEFTSIITLSLAQITYMGILLIKSISILKEVKLERGHI